MRGSTHWQPLARFFSEALMSQNVGIGNPLFLCVMSLYVMHLSR